MKVFDITTPLISAFALAGWLCASTAGAAPAANCPACRPAGRVSGLYNPNTKETIKGGVIKVEHVARRWGMNRGVDLLVKTDSGRTVTVALGPAWFVKHQEIQFRAGDRVEITGSKVSIGDRSALIASEIRKGDEILQLRGANGMPVWAGWRHENAMASNEPGGPMMGRGMMNGGMGYGMMNGNRGQALMRGGMDEQHHQMLAENQKLSAEMNRLDADLQKKLAHMNELQGSAKVDAMAAVINDLVKERQVVRGRMNLMRERMEAHMNAMMQGTNTGNNSQSAPNIQSHAKG